MAIPVHGTHRYTLVHAPTADARASSAWTAAGGPWHLTLPILLLATAAWAASRLVSWARRGSDPSPTAAAAAAAPPAPQPTVHLTPAERWVLNRLQDQALAAAAIAGDDKNSPLFSLPSHAPAYNVSRLICCARAPHLPSLDHPSSSDGPSAPSAATSAIRRAVQRYSSAPGSPPLSGLLVVYPPPPSQPSPSSDPSSGAGPSTTSALLLVLEGDSSAVCATLRELLSPTRPPPLPSSSSTPASPLPALVLDPNAARVLAFDPEAGTRMYPSWHEAHLDLPSTSRAPGSNPTQTPLTRAMLRPPSLTAPTPGPKGAAWPSPHLPGSSPTPPSSKGLRGGLAFMSEAEMQEAAEGVGLFVQLVAAKLQNLPGSQEWQQLLQGLAREPSLPSRRAVLGLSASEAAPTLPYFLEQYDVEYERYSEQYREEHVELYGEPLGGGKGLRDGETGEDGGAGESSSRSPEWSRLEYLYRGHLEQELQREARLEGMAEAGMGLGAGSASAAGESASVGREGDSPLARYYPKKQTQT